MSAPIFQLTIRSGPNPGQTFPLEQEEMVLGRDLVNDITINDPEVSRRHARFTLQGDSIVIEDLGSTNGSFLNGQRITGPQQLRAGDVITLGENIVMVFDKADYDADATVVATQAERTSRPTPIPPPAPPQYQQPPQQAAYQAPPVRPPQPVQPPKKRSIPAWLIVLIIAIVVVACVIAVTLWYMPASWWCALTFNMLEGCPLP